MSEKLILDLVLVCLFVTTIFLAVRAEIDTKKHEEMIKKISNKGEVNNVKRIRKISINEGGTSKTKD